MDDIKNFIRENLQKRKDQNAFRSLSHKSALIDFCSNDYLGLARSEKLRSMINSSLSNQSEYPIGATGSRLISGNDQFTEQLESEIAQFHQAESALIFNSGYDANIGLLSSLPQRGDTVILDELIHASIIDGTRLAFGKRYTFKHNDVTSLEEKLKLATGKIYIGVESVYSMDGDSAPLVEILNLAEKFGAAVIVDEAHAVGVFGKNGAGMAVDQGLSHRIFARTITFGKSLGCHGAAIIGSSELREYLINFARSFIYTTSGSFFTHLSTKLAYQCLSDDLVSTLRGRITQFKAELGTLSDRFIPSTSPIQCMLIPGNRQANEIASGMRSKGFDVRAILHPTVPQGKERLRICLHSFNSTREIQQLVSELKNLV